MTLEMAVHQDKYVNNNFLSQGLDETSNLALLYCQFIDDFDMQGDTMSMYGYVLPLNIFPLKIIQQKV